ncbi:MAG: outer membrane lipoprotein carrier protein LolA [Bryobacter sp.]|jgi:outer membrane lipoprotein carrier protein|nr:outer membrane lipoprotein carrier protein LolA [Bryobacter sp.]
MMPVWILLLSQAAPLDSLVAAAERRYNSARTLEIRFEQTYKGARQPIRKESGRALLMKPGRMRWEYDQPPGKLFVADGKQIWSVHPQREEIERAKLKEAVAEGEDFRAPLAFLLGRLDFRKLFGKLSAEGAAIRAEAKNDRAPYEAVRFEIAPDGRIVRLAVEGRDRSVMEFRFLEERLNAPLAASLFVFSPPPGARVVESAGER